MLQQEKKPKSQVISELLHHVRTAYFYMRQKHTPTCKTVFESCPLRPNLIPVIEQISELEISELFTMRKRKQNSENNSETTRNKQQSITVIIQKSV